MTPKQRRDDQRPMSFGEWQQSRGASPESSEDVTLGGDFTLGGIPPQPGLRSPDAIDRPGSNVLTITTSVGVQAMPPEEMALLQQQLKAAGLTPDGFQVSGTLDEDTAKALTELKEVSKTTGMSDMDTLRTRIEQAAQAAVSGQASGQGTGGTQRQVSKTISEPVFTDPITARATVRQAIESRLGRAPTADEYHQFRKLLSNSEAGQDVTTSTTTADAAGNTTTRVRRSDDTTNPSAAVLADEFTRKGRLGREANTVQAASYFDVIARRVGG